MPFPYYAVSRNGVPVRLTEERWFHITKHHPELKKFRSLVLDAVNHPNRLFLFARTGDMAAVAQFRQLVRLGVASNLVVHYKEVSDRDGFIVTAFPMSKQRMRRRFSRWQRLK